MPDPTMPHRIIESVLVAPMAGVVTASGFANVAAPSGDWTSALIGPASGLVVSLLVLWFLKGYYDKSLAREQENRNDIREMLEKVIDLSAKQHEQFERANDAIEENSSLLRSVAQALNKCYEKHQSTTNNP